MLFILGLLLKLPVFFDAKPPIIKEHDSLAYIGLVNSLKPIAVLFPSIYVIIAYLLIFTQIVLVSFFINNNKLMLKANFLPGMSYMILTSLMPEFNVLSSPLIASTIYVALFLLLFSGHNQKTTKDNIFNAGLILGLAVLIFFPSVLLIILAYAILASLRPFKLNEWLILLIGTVTPAYFLGITLYLTDSLSWKYFYNGIEIGLAGEKYTIWHAGALFLTLMPFLVGFYYVQALSGRMLIHVRKAWNLFILYAAICIVISFFNIEQGLENWVLLMLPLAALHGFGYFNAELKLYPKIAFWLSAGFIIASQLFSGLW